MSPPLVPSFEPTGAQALAWLRDPVRRDPPGFLPAVQASEALAAWFRSEGSRADTPGGEVAGGGEALRALEERARGGSSAAARALSFVQEVAVDLASADARSPRADARARLLSAVRAIEGQPRPLPAWGAEDLGAPDLAPVVAVARRHASRSDEAERLAAISRASADVRGGDPQLEQVLERLAAVIEAPLLVVSVVHAGETVHRAYRSRLDGPVPRAVPREASFCTHCVADAAPLIIEDALRDPFFRQHPAVHAFGLRAYFGVPIRLPSAADARVAGPVVGTLCGYDQRARAIGVEDLAVLEIFARRCGEILGGPGAASPPGAGASDATPWASPNLDEASSAAAGIDVYAPAFFADLMEVARLAARAGRPAALLVGPVEPTVPDPGWGVIAGRLPDGRAGWLITGTDVATRLGVAAASLRGRVRGALGYALLDATSATSPAFPASAADWVRAAAPAAPRS